MAQQKTSQSDKKIIKTPCRATKGCDSRTAVILRASSGKGGGKNLLYKCTKCGKPFGLFY